MTPLGKDALALIDPSLFEAVHILLRETLPLVPPAIALAKLNRVLDAGCGQHYWGKALFQTMVQQAGRDLVSDVRIEGIDLDAQVVQAANRQMRLGRGQVVAWQGDWFHLPIALHERYDLVHLHFLAPFVAPSAWTALLQEQWRACKPGRWLVWSEPTIPDSCTGAPGWNAWLGWIEQACLQVGGSPHISETMETFLVQAGDWEEMQTQTTVVPLIKVSPIQSSLLAKEYRVLCTRLTMLAEVMEAAGLAQDMLAQGTERVRAELNARRVVCDWTWKTVSARKRYLSHP